MSSTTYAADVLTRHQIYLQRYAGGIVNQLLPLLNTMSRDVSAQILAADVTQFQMGRLIVLQRDINNLITATLSELQGQLTLDLTDLIDYEAGFTQRLLDQMVNVQTSGLDVGTTASLLSNSQMGLVQGGSVVNMTMDQAFTQFSRTATNDITAMVQSGIAQGRTTREIASDVRGLINNRTRAQTEALIRTTANHAGNLARDQMYQENSDILDGEKFIATLDGRTTMTCAGNDGKIFNLGEGPRPPLHFNCRSVRIPIVNEAFTISGLRGERASMDGPVSAQRTFGGWLRDQPVSVQNEVLGPERANLFRNGGLSIDRFTDNSGVVYTLDELRGLEPQAFE